MQIFRGFSKVTGMIARTAAAGSRLSRPVQSVVQEHHLLAVQARRLHVIAMHRQGSCARLHGHSSMPFQQLESNRQCRQISMHAAEGSGILETVYELDCSLPENQADLSPEYHNYFSLVGNLGRIDREPIQGQPHFAVTIKVARQAAILPGEAQQYDTFFIDCWGNQAASAAADSRLKEDQYVRIFGQLISGPNGLKLEARDFAIILNADSPTAVMAAAAPYNPAAAAADYSEAPAATPASQQSRGLSPAEVTGMPNSPGSPHEQQWMVLFNNPNTWWDNRDRKKNPKAPDFTLKDKAAAPQGCPDALWVEDRKTPAWVKTNLQLLPGGKPYEPPNGGSSSSSGYNGLAAAAAPGRGGPRPSFLPDEGAPMSEKEAAWVDVFLNYRNWWDNRLNKLSEKSPDFKHRQNGAALWLSDRQTPDWVQQNIGTGLPPPPPKRV